MLFERLKHPCAERDATSLPVALLARLRPPLGMNALDGGNGVRLVDVPPFERERLLGVARR
jgi:hypothetical protein